MPRRRRWSGRRTDSPPSCRCPRPSAVPLRTPCGEVRPGAPLPRLSPGRRPPREPRGHRLAAVWPGAEREADVAEGGTVGFDRRRPGGGDGVMGLGFLRNHGGRRVRDFPDQPELDLPEGPAPAGRPGDGRLGGSSARRKSVGGLALRARRKSSSTAQAGDGLRGAGTAPAPVIRSSFSWHTTQDSTCSPTDRSWEVPSWSARRRTSTSVVGQVGITSGPPPGGLGAVRDPTAPGGPSRRAASSAPCCRP